MAVSDESAGSTAVLLPIPKRKPFVQRKLSPAEWQRIRVHYETADPRIGLRALADSYGISRTTVMHRCRHEKWVNSGAIIQTAKSELQQATTLALKQVAADTAQTVAKSIMDDLQPFIEREKRLHIKSQIRRGNRALKRLDALSEAEERLDARDEAFIAKSVDTYDNVKRRNLGMNDSAGVSGALSFRILTDSAAIEVSHS